MQAARACQSSQTERRAPCADQPIDLVHLARQSFGDTALESEILNLFATQTHLHAARLRNACTQAERSMATHTLLGSARGVGAFRLATELEQLRDGSGDLSRTVEEALTAARYARSLVEEA